jgi:NhaP-type Na+/H+ or K+/H+ antiporter
MVFVAIGLLVGPLVAHQFTVAPSNSGLRTLAEATVAVVFFLDASRIRLRQFRREYMVPLRLLGAGLPLTVALGALLAGALFGELNFGEALVLAIVLAPTDAMLSAAVVTEPRLPSRIRQGLNVESGLNDGPCLPLLLIALAIADVEAHPPAAHAAVRLVAEEIGYGILGGAAAGVVAAAIVVCGSRRDLITGAWLQVIPVAAAALAYGLASALGGSGFIAAFLAGALFGALVGEQAENASRFGEEVGAVLGGVTFLVFGAVLLGPALESLSWQIAAYAVLSLTVVRMVPVAIALLGSGASPPTVAFLGWFGPRGLASIVFAVIVVEEANVPGADTILTVAYTTIGLSVLAHGVSAAPLADRYARWYESHSSRQPAAMEAVPAPAHRPRGPAAASRSKQD